jgi:hypothetical protein
VSDLRELERIAYRASLALRCHDAVSGQVVGDELTATAWRRADPTQAWIGRRSPVSSLLGFGSLPGRQRVRAPAGQPITWPPASPDPYVVRIIDLGRRYLPTIVTASVPSPTVVDVPLHSAPARSRPSGWATVRGELQDATTGAGLAWGVIQVDTGVDVYHTLSDGRARFLLYLPYPEALPPLLGSPPLGPGLGAVTWPLTISVRCQPSALRWPPGAASGDPPELASVTGQAAAQIDEGGPRASVVRTLTFGTPLTALLHVVPA